jgi:hypothetical protein
VVEWISFFPEVCKHGVDQRYKFTSEKFEDGSVLSGMTRAICRQCLAEIDLRACLEYVRAHDTVKADDE